MSKSKNFRISEIIPRLLESDCQKRFKTILFQQFHVVEVDNKGASVVFHYRLDEQSELKTDVIMYSTGKLYLSSSPKMGGPLFSDLKKRVFGIADQCVKTLSETRPLTALRAISILEFASKLSLSDEYNRMVSVILCDTANEIVLTETMRKERISGPPLDEGITKKIQHLEKKGIVIPYQDDIKSIRNLRNDVVHQGVIPDVKQTEMALQKTSEFIKTM